MTCRVCGAIIAARAIVCYKCGTATADGPEVPRAPAARTPLRLFLLMLGVAAALTGVVVWLIPQTPDGTWMRWGACGAVPVIVYAGVRLIRGPRSSKLRRR